MEKLFYSVNDICERYCIGKTRAYKHIRIIKEIYKIDELRLPKKGVLPANMVKEYFNQGKNKKDHSIANW